ncbi:related to amidase [Sporisorium reilianum SRZ2]|uniref:Related to amidase n=1 Tax=Sporisorium reilianum (strain SRZ2) TaxID=999809 RepID=E6ZVK1_SPORE|nr:related to amidase [Sporisorium reilianum SRZ2]
MSTSTTTIPRGEFRNPHPHLNPAAQTAVDTLLATVTAAHHRFGDPTPTDYEIASCPLSLLQERIIDNSLTVRRVVEARIRLTVKASLDTHCLTACAFDQALQAAEFYDGDFDDDDAHDALRAFPLLGLVFSVKDCIHVQGLATTLGCSSRVGQGEEATADIVRKLTDAGGIMIAKTTAPQLMMSNTTTSPVWGTTRSAVIPADGGEEFQVGGSSGGEASLVRMGGSQLGVGTDMGGSVRQPACLNEVCAFKFSSSTPEFRWQLPDDFMTGLPHTSVPATAPGILSRDWDTLRLAAEALYGARYANVTELTDDDFIDVYPDDPQPQPEDLGNTPRLVYTAQHSSPEVQQLIKWLIEKLAAGDARARPSAIAQLGDVDLAAWSAAWAQHATQHGFDAARAMLAHDPLITRTMFDDARVGASAPVKASWAPDPAQLAQLKAQFLRQARIVHGGEAENVILLTPTYALGGPVQQRAFVQLDDQGLSEIWCQILNLLDWPAVSVPIALPRAVRDECRRAALGEAEWAQYLPGREGVFTQWHSCRHRGKMQLDAVRDRLSEKC